MNKEKLEVKGTTYGENVTISIILVVLILSVFFKYNFDFLDARKINQFEVSNSSYTIKNMVIDYRKYDDSAYDYDAELRGANVYVSGEVKVDELTLNEQTKEMKVITRSFDMFWDGHSDKPSQFVIWFDYLPTEKELKSLGKGEKIKFRAKVNKINGTYIILEEGEIIYD